MRSLKLIGIALLASLSLTIAATSAAQAVTLKFLPEKSTFKFAGNGSSMLETLGKKRIVCLSFTGSGEIHSERLGQMVFFFTDCLEASLKLKCTGLSDTTTGNITIAAEWHLRHLLSPNEAAFDIAILVSAVHFSCAGLLFTVNGCVASDDLVRKSIWLAGELASIFEFAFLLSNGDAAVPSIDTDNSLGMENCILLTKQEAGTAESSGEEGSAIAEKCEAGGLECTFLVDLTGTQ